MTRKFNEKMLQLLYYISGDAIFSCQKTSPNLPAKSVIQTHNALLVTKLSLQEKKNDANHILTHIQRRGKPSPRVPKSMRMRLVDPLSLSRHHYGSI